MRTTFCSLAVLLSTLALGCSAGDNEGPNGPGVEPGSGGSGGSAANSAGGSANGTSGAGVGTSGNASPAGGGGASQGGGGINGGGGRSGAGGSGGSGGSPGAGGAGGSAMMVTAKGCPATQAPGTWKNVTDPAMKLPDDFHGPITVGVDVVHPNDIYVHAMADGTWKSIDCGMTWKKVSTGMNGDRQDSGRQWFATIDRNPNRDPATSPTMYVTQGYGANGIWKSTNGGVDWTDVFAGNVFAEDGVTNTSKDVGNDMSGIFIVDATGPNHLIAYLHSYGGTMGNNGVFESKDGAAKWVVHKAATFNFQPHSDILFPYDATTWMVAHGDTVYRTTDGAATWNVNAGKVSINLGRAYIIVGTTMYAGTDYAGGAYKSTDQGLTWTNLNAPGNRISWVAATKTKLYASNDRDSPHVYHASLDNDKVWVDDGAPGMVHGGANTPGVIFDGDHYVLVSAAERGGVWRYVEP